MEELISSIKPSLINSKLSNKQQTSNRVEIFTYPNNLTPSRLNSSHGKNFFNSSTSRADINNLTALKEDSIIKKAFNLLDPMKIDSVNRDELMSILQEINFQSKDLNINLIIDKLKKMQNKISYKEFCRLFLIESSSFKDIMDTKKVFELFDNSEKGYISIQNLIDINEQLGKTKSGNQLIEMIRIADSDEDWLVTLEDMHNILKNSTPSFQGI